MIVLHTTEHWRAPQHAAEYWGSSLLPRPVLTIGNFDGVHRGHRALIDATRSLAESMRAPTAVLTFDPAPRDVLRPGHGIPRIESLQRRLVHLEDAGVDVVVIQTFDEALAGVEPAAFAAEHLGDHLAVAAVCVGHDFRFGHKRAGDAALLRQVLDVPVHEVAALEDEQGPISSSRIRAALREGDVGLARRLLGRPHELTGVVVRGDQRGRTIGFPTANLAPGGGLLPPNGVYAVQVDLDGVLRPGVANLGTRPTFDGSEVRLEVHLFGGDFALYGRTLVVGLVERLREERAFSSVDELVEQIRRDAAAAREILG